MGKTKIRFKGYTEDWEQRKFGDLGSVAMCKGFLKNRQRQLEKSHFIKLGLLGLNQMLSFRGNYLKNTKVNFSIPMLEIC